MAKPNTRDAFPWPWHVHIAHGPTFTLAQNDGLIATENEAETRKVQSADGAATSECGEITAHCATDGAGATQNAAEMRRATHIQDGAASERRRKRCPRHMQSEAKAHKAPHLPRKSTLETYNCCNCHTKGAEGGHLSAQKSLPPMTKRPPNTKN